MVCCVSFDSVVEPVALVEPVAFVCAPPERTVGGCPVGEGVVAVVVAVPPVAKDVEPPDVVACSFPAAEAVVFTSVAEEPPVGLASNLAVLVIVEVEGPRCTDGAREAGATGADVAGVTSVAGAIAAGVVVTAGADAVGVRLVGYVIAATCAGAAAG